MGDKLGKISYKATNTHRFASRCRKMVNGNYKIESNIKQLYIVHLKNDFEQGYFIIF